MLYLARARGDRLRIDENMHACLEMKMAVSDGMDCIECLSKDEMSTQVSEQLLSIDLYRSSIFIHV